ncbi:hypothetical protein X797_008593 [Metarhizium robertsii]|uniref:Uncharacterized protein n=2 Tax=Metarhizium robertsii TaxID=568076 RepID=E9EPR9_METRA|nr:uncharacterized protein MAA_01704 [Metarhizium robertsii ARSEF 23]EFZ02122.1 hypothetical protein MAA_01704 [Metarhizium robertsii ARSEF 23]EXU98203.1 hypothetical protein X797_008593 [Metarhizium robertsii]
MASFRDVREDHANESHDQLRDKVLTFWPNGKHDLGASTSGINCLIVLLKRIYVSMNEPIWNKHDESVKKMEADNPFMAHAWLLLGLSLNTIGVALDNLIVQVWGKKLDNVAPEDLHFKNLVSHARMQTTLWSMPQFNLMLEHLWWQQDTRRWRRLQHKATPTEVKDYFAKWHPTPTPDSVRLDAFPGMSLDVEVNKLFGEFSVGEFTVLVRPDAPSFFYATFTVKDVGQEKLDFNAFRRFTLEVGKSVDVDGVMRWQRTGRPGQMPYNLMAIVKYRDTADGSDLIRVYDDFGNNSIPVGKLPDYASPEWRMADMKNGDTFLALFVYSRMPPKSRPPFPEVYKNVDKTEFCEQSRFFSKFSAGRRVRKRE